MPTSVVTIDSLNSLLEAEANSIFHFVGQGSPYLNQAGPAVRNTLEELARHLDAHQSELSHLIRALGGQPATPTPPLAEEQYLSYLSLRFLLPKLVDAKELMIERYKNALTAVEHDPKAVEVLQRHLAEMQQDLVILKKTSADVVHAK